MPLETKRLILRNWIDSDIGPFIDMCADKEVMRYFPSVLTRQESLEMARMIKSLIDHRGWGFWAVECKKRGTFSGFVGLHIPKAHLPCSPCVEVGWRLRKECWGNGYASEAAQAALEFGFGELNLNAIVAFTAKINTPSIRVMERIGMSNTGRDFAHPDIPAQSALREHVLYQILKTK